MTYRGPWYGGDREDGASFEYRGIAGGRSTESGDRDAFIEQYKELVKKEKKKKKKKE